MALLDISCVLFYETSDTCVLLLGKYAGDLNSLDALRIFAASSNDCFRLSGDTNSFLEGRGLLSLLVLRSDSYSLGSSPVLLCIWCLNDLFDRDTDNCCEEY